MPDDASHELPERPESLKQFGKASAQAEGWSLPESSRPVHATKEEIEVRVEYVVMMLVEGRRRSEIIRFFRTQYSLAPRTVAHYIRRARKRLVSASEKSTDDLRAESYAWYMDVLRRDDVDVGTKLVARRAVDDLLGLQKPKKIAPTTSDGEDLLDLVVNALSREELQAIEKAGMLAEEAREDRLRKQRESRASRLKAVAASDKTLGELQQDYENEVRGEAVEGTTDGEDVAVSDAD